jgi:hypothetical protein
LRHLAVALVALYLTVGLFAPACPVESASAGHGHRHHGGAEHGVMPHSLLCAWSCQVSPLLDLAESSSLPGPVRIILSFVLAPVLKVLSSNVIHLPARAPPFALFSAA